MANASATWICKPVSRAALREHEWLGARPKEPQILFFVFTLDERGGRYRTSGDAIQTNPPKENKINDCSEFLKSFQTRKEEAF